MPAKAPPSLAYPNFVNPMQHIFGDRGARPTSLGRPLAGLAAALCILSFPGHVSATPFAPGTAAVIPASGIPTLQLQPIPEPQTWVTAFAGLGTLIALQRFRRVRATRKP